MRTTIRLRVLPGAVAVIALVAGCTNTNTAHPSPAATASTSSVGMVTLRGIPIASFTCAALGENQADPSADAYRIFHGVGSLRLCPRYPKRPRRTAAREQVVMPSDRRLGPVVAALAAPDVQSDGKTLLACSDIHYSTFIADTAAGAFRVRTPTNPCGEQEGPVVALAGATPGP